MTGDKKWLMRPERAVGIVGYGAYIPRYRLPGAEIARIWTGGNGGSPSRKRRWPGLDEDVVTMAIEAARNAIVSADIDPEAIRAVGSAAKATPMR